LAKPEHGKPNTIVLGNKKISNHIFFSPLFSPFLANKNEARDRVCSAELITYQQVLDLCISGAASLVPHIAVED